MKNCLVIGGGIIGLCSAYYLIKEGHQVTIIDKTNMDSGTSWVNAGYISPGHIIPLSAPGVMKKGIKWMFNEASPLFIKPRFDVEFLRWVWLFNKSCNAKHVSKSIPIIKDIAVFSQDLYKDIKASENFRFHLEKKGLLMLCQSDALIEEEEVTTKLANEAGLEANMLSLAQLKEMEPDVALNVKGGSIYHCDAHCTPMEFMTEMKEYLLQNGVQFLNKNTVKKFKLDQNSIKEVQTDERKINPDEVILTAGAWTAELAKQVGLRIPLQAGKGYSISSKREQRIRMPAILAEAKVAITPMNGFTRFAGTMEIAGISETINRKRVEAIASAANRYYPDIELTKAEKDNATSGLRPLSADGLPYIGRSEKCENLTVATGHAMMGWSMATATGKLIAEIISDQKTSLNLEPFSIERFN